MNVPLATLAAVTASVALPAEGCDLRARRPHTSAIVEIHGHGEAIPREPDILIGSSPSFDFSSDRCESECVTLVTCDPHGCDVLTGGQGSDVLYSACGDDWLY